MRRIAVLWSEFPPYVAACVQALAMRAGVEISVVRYAYPADKPFDARARSLTIPVYTISARDPLRHQWDELGALLRDFEPNVAIVSGWAIPAFNRAARYVRQRGGTVICTSDNPWRGNLKHTLGAVFAKPLFRCRYAALFVPGERARPLANALGFTGKRLITGSYSCDWPLYAGAYGRLREDSDHGWPHAFIFVGSLIERKGLPDIIEAYRAYRLEVDNPWELWVVGDGPLRSSLETGEGIVPLGFKQPVECAELMARAGAFILASHSEPWGVVIHEAATAGLPVLCTDICGAAADLVSDGHSGYLFEPGDADHLRALMVRLTQMSDQQLETMGRNSHELSKQFTPELWADRLLRGLERLGS
jgi:glycosyltransferase involved in cell wall biosynthesis